MLALLVLKRRHLVQAVLALQGPGRGSPFLAENSKEFVSFRNGMVPVHAKVSKCMHVGDPLENRQTTRPNNFIPSAQHGAKDDPSIAFATTAQIPATNQY